jgi:hypothetical protein
MMLNGMSKIFTLRLTKLNKIGKMINNRSFYQKNRFNKTIRIMKMKCKIKKVPKGLFFKVKNKKKIH